MPPKLRSRSVTPPEDVTGVPGSDLARMRRLVVEYVDELSAGARAAVPPRRARRRAGP